MQGAKRRFKGSGYLFFTVISLSPVYSVQGRDAPSFFSTKKKPAPTREEEGWMRPAARDSVMYFSMTSRSGFDSW